MLLYLYYQLRHSTTYNSGRPAVVLVHVFFAIRVWVNTASHTIISSLTPSRAYLRILYPLWTSSKPRTNDLLKGQITFYTERTVSRCSMTYKRLNGTTLSYVKFFEKIVKFIYNYLLFSLKLSAISPAQWTPNDEKCLELELWWNEINYRIGMQSLRSNLHKETLAKQKDLDVLLYLSLLRVLVPK